jgi:hypothetical protein
MFDAAVVVVDVVEAPSVLLNDDGVRSISKERQG